MNFYRFLFALVLLVGGGCSLLPLGQEISPPTPTPTLQTPTPTRAQPVENATPQAGPLTLRIWLPVEFDPAADRPAARILQARLDEFVASHPRLRLEIRLKSLQDQGGMLESLITANAAAPLVLPDLVALPRPLMEAAALKGLLQPLDGQTDRLTEPEWYEYARQLGRVQSSTFGLPFAGDSLLLIYRPLEDQPPTASLRDSLEYTGPLAFPAADPQALYLLNLYQAAGGKILDDQGRPSLDEKVLISLLAFLHEAEQADVIPLWMTQIETDNQAWEVFNSGRADRVITWASRFLKSPPENLSASVAPTLDGTPYSLSTGWVWSLTGASTEKQALALELAEFLTEKQFLAEWTAAAGYLPPRSDALAEWGAGPAKDLAQQAVGSMSLSPTSDILSAIAPALKQAAIQVLKQQGDAATIARETVNLLANP
jgi:ABC-type glycerol-3-phosphate transport system substrate-binding protein